MDVNFESLFLPSPTNRKRAYEELSIRLNTTKDKRVLRNQRGINLKVSNRTRLQQSLARPEPGQALRSKVASRLKILNSSGTVHQHLKARGNPTRENRNLDLQEFMTEQKPPKISNLNNDLNDIRIIKKSEPLLLKHQSRDIQAVISKETLNFKLSKRSPRKIFKLKRKILLGSRRSPIRIIRPYIAKSRLRNLQDLSDTNLQANNTFEELSVMHPHTIDIAKRNYTQRFKSNCRRRPLPRLMPPSCILMRNDASTFL
ncbi:unnamed protein product [Moneuplotes crassus]|uniref:Uncharacterized protein n=1 Tax=Euplotes crassus TaxID=5936 RepID=A0AAD1UE46_EUPCR|nr:unnamed protein product [Moneuplotes crassus]